MKTKYIPAGYHTATPYLIVKGAARAMDFYQQAFGATEVLRMDGPGGKAGGEQGQLQHPKLDGRPLHSARA